MESNSQLFNRLKQDNMEALKKKEIEKRSVLSSIINKCMQFSIEKRAKGEEISDADVINLIQKVDKELDEEIAGFKLAKNSERVDVLQRQKAYLLQYLPAQLTVEEIQSIIRQSPSKNIKDLMAHFKTNYPGRVDLKLVSEIAKGLH